MNISYYFVEHLFYTDNFYFSCSHVVVSVAVVRIFGQELAELPIVATSSRWQGQVICCAIDTLFYHRCVD
jgi:hypothetical protein